MQIGNYKLSSKLILAPMAGISDQSFRKICYSLGAGLTISEMLSSNPLVWKSMKSTNRMNNINDCGIPVMQIVGSDPKLMADAAKLNVKNGAKIIDINMGCPAKKVNKKQAGSALLQYPNLVAEILKAVVEAVDVPVTLKIRTGWDKQNKNALEIAKIAQNAGIQALTIHGRTREDLYKGHAEYETIKLVKQNIQIPVIANGDITNPQIAKAVLDYTGADAIMIGRGSQGNPWIFQQINHYLKYNEILEKPSLEEVLDVLIEHLSMLYDLYGELKGVRIARKHIAWYLKKYSISKDYLQDLYKLESSIDQINAVKKVSNII